MGNDPSCVAQALKVWSTQIDRANKLFGALSSEEVLREIAPGRNRVLYLWGHLTAAHDAMLPLLGLREALANVRTSVRGPVAEIVRARASSVARSFTPRPARERREVVEAASAVRAMRTTASRHRQSL
jgi:hypothetical protein